MDLHFGQARYITRTVEDHKEGYAGLELHRTASGETSRVARILFWDASGQFFIETFNNELPLAVIEGLIAEAKAAIRIE